MKTETRILLDEYKEEFKSYKKYIDNNNWFDDVQEDKNGNMYSNKLNTELAMVSTILKTMKKFAEDVGEDGHLKEIKKFIDDTVDIVKKHVMRIDKYKKMYPFDDSTSDKEMKFQTELWGKKISTKLELSKLNIDEKEESKKSLELFHGKTKAPLLMREYLCDTLPIIEQKTNQLTMDFSAPIINPATSNEMLINMKSKDIPKWDVNKHFFEQDLSTIQFWEEEIRKIKNGVNIGGYHIHPWLYWHLNIFMLAYGTGANKKPKNPKFRDNEYFFTEMLTKAERHGKCGLLMYGSRRISKSVVMTSYLQRILYTVRNAKCTVLGFSAIPDLKAIVDYMNESITNMNPALRINANNLDLNAGITLGLKRTAQERLDYTDLTFVNLESGSKKGAQKPAASTPDAFVFDEALRWNEKVVTDQGFVNISDIRIGDEIYDPNGKLTKIVDKINVGKKQLYEMTLSNGVKVESCGEHLWEVKDKFNKGKLFVKKTEDLIKDVKVYGGRSKYSIRKTKPVEFSNKSIKLDPYYLGLWLGDGSKNKTTVTTTDIEIVEYIEKYSTELGMSFSKKIKKDGDRKTDTYSVDIVKNEGSTNYVLQCFRHYGIFNNKRIPKEYLYNSVDIRLNLIRGMMDSDGTISKKGLYSITLSKKDLFDDFVDMMESLGVSVNVSDRVIKNRVYHVANFNTDLDVFKLTRKKVRQKESESLKGLHNKQWISIVDIKPSVIDDAYCIKVDNDSKLFLTTTYVSTHNCGKGECIKPWDAAKPSFADSENGGKWRLVPILSGTAGESELSSDAELMLKNPQTYDCMAMDWDLLEDKVDPEYITWNRQNFGYFVPAQLSIEAPNKITTPFAKFLGDEDLLESCNINIDVTDWKAAKEYFDKRRSDVSKDIDILARLTNSFPMDVEDCYLTSEVNKFPGMLAKRRKQFVIDNGIEGQKVWLIRNGDRVEAQQTADKTISEYPYKGGNIDAPIVMLDDPNAEYAGKPPLGLYCIGFDDVKQDRSDGDSVMSATVFKRSYEGGVWSNRIVAYYDSRPARKRDYYRNLYLLIKFYNARILHENEDNGFVEYMEDNHMEDIYTHLSDGVGLATEENLNRNKNRKFGWAPTGLNIYNLEQTLVMYTKEEGIIIGHEEDLTGVDRINHPMLLEELYKYKKDNNADRIRSFGLALKLARYYDKTNAYMKTRFQHTPEEQDTIRRQNLRKTVKGFTHTNKLTKF